jgi:hypothetical protein
MAEQPWDETPSGWTPEQLVSAAKAVFGLLVDEASWVHRRVDSVSFVGRRGICRQMSVDFTLPRAVRETLRGLPEKPVPLAMMRREPLIDFDLLDESAGAIPLWTRQACDRLTFDVLRVACGVFDVDLRGREGELLWPVAGGRQGAADDFLTAVGRERVSGDPLSWLVAALESTFPLVASVPRSLSGRRVLKFRYEYVDPRGGAGAGLLAQLGLRPSAVLFRMAAVGRSDAYHFELRAPEDLMIVDARFEEADEYGISSIPRQRLSATQAVAHLYLADDLGPPRLPPRLRRARERALLWRARLTGGTRAKRLVAPVVVAASRTLLQEPEDPPAVRARVYLGASQTGTPALALIASVFATGLLWLLSAHSTALVAARGVSGTTTSGAAVASLILVVPGIAIGVVGRPASMLSSRLLGLLELAVLLVAAILMLATLEVIFATRATDLRRVLADLGNVTLAVAAVAFLAWSRAVWHGRRRPRR